MTSVQEHAKRTQKGKNWSVAQAAEFYGWSHLAPSTQRQGRWLVAVGRKDMAYAQTSSSPGCMRSLHGTHCGDSTEPCPGSSTTSQTVANFALGARETVTAHCHPTYAGSVHSNMCVPSPLESIEKPRCFPTRHAPISSTRASCASPCDCRRTASALMVPVEVIAVV